MELTNASSDIAQAVCQLARNAIHFSDADLNQPYRWGAHQEGVRFALIGAMHELRTLAVNIAADCRHAGILTTRAQHALSHYHAAFRDLDAILLGLPSDDVDKTPAVGEWSVRETLAHMIHVQRNFFALVHYGLRRQREGGDFPAELPDGEADRLLGAIDAITGLFTSGGSLEELYDYYTRIHYRTLSEFASIDDIEVDGPSIWWEGEPFTLEYRIHRMEAHLRQHAIQIEKILEQIGHPISEARRLLRVVLAALAEVEGLLISFPTVDDTKIVAVARSIHRLADDAAASVANANSMLAAVTGGDRERVRTLVEEYPQLVNVLSSDGVSVARLAAYYDQKEIAEILVRSPEIDLDIWDGAALGQLVAVEKNIQWAGDQALNTYSRDGYTPLQLACFFGHEEVANYLIIQGADIHAISRNPMSIQPIHAAAAGNHLGILRLLLQAGADPNAMQQDGFRPLHAAAQNGSAAMVHLLVEHGADPALPNGKGHLPRQLAEESGVAEVIDLLS